MNKNITSQILENQKKYNKSVEVVVTLLNSDYSIEEFCHMNLKYNIKDIKNMIFSVSKQDRNEILDILSKRTYERIMPSIEKIVMEIINDELDIVDYYMLTKLNFSDFYEIISLQIDNIKVLNKIKSFISFNREKVKENHYMYVISQELETNSFSKINDVVITKEQKEKIFRFMENNIPITLHTYGVLKNKVINGDINIDELVKTKK